MLQNITNFFNLIRGNKIKTTPDGSDLIPLGTRDPRYDGFYQPTGITVDDFIASLPPDINLYNSNGTLTGNRTVAMAGNTLNLSGGNVGINTTPTQLLDVNGVTRHRGNVNMDNGAGIVWNDLTGIVPTSVNSRISWTLNNDRAEIYAWQPSSNDIDFVFKLRDDVTTTTDNYVFWMQDNAGEAADRYPLEMSGPAFIVNPLRRYATLPANANSGNTDFYVLKENATGLADSLIFGDVSATRVGINTSSPTETLDVNGKTKTTTFQMTTTPALNKALISDASGNGSWTYLPTDIQLAASDESTALTTGSAKVTFRMPYAMTVTAVRASLSTAQASGSIFTVDINEGGTTILSTKLTIDNTEKTSTTAATPAVISDSALADDAEITIDIDQIGDGTAAGLKVTIIGTRA
jgi:hypothetical protein